MKENFERIISLYKTRLHAGVSPEQISAFEQKSRVRLPSAYKEWLAISDGGEIFCPSGPELLGVATDKPHLLIRSGDGKEAPEKMVVIGRTSSGDALCCESGTERVIQWSHAPFEEFMAWDDFFSYLRQVEEMYGNEE